MVPYRRQKIENAILLFARLHRERTDRDLYQTYLYKYLALTEFEHLRQYGLPVFGLKYKAMKNGPVPVEIYSESRFRHTATYRFEEDEWGVFVSLAGREKPDLNYFTMEERSIMRAQVNEHAHEFSKTEYISEASHENIRAWREAYRRMPNSFMDYADEIQDATGQAQEIFDVHAALNGHR